jgi:thiol-disulfide isomerase/thioredoxin
MKQILYFSAKWCSGCQSTSPLIEQFQRNNRNIPVEKIDTDYDSSYVEKYKVKSIPTTIILENGNEIKRYVGALGYEQLNRLING